MTSASERRTVRAVGGYTLLARLGEGGMGVVHLARREGGERVALKVLRPHIVGDEEARRRLAREVGSLSRVRSRWVAEIVDADPWADVPYVATRYVPGLSLHDQVIEEGPVAGRDLLWLAACLAEGIASVHAVGVLHRDVKPSNVLMEGRTPILIDFGLARVADDPKLTHTGWLLGTPGYLAPEILYGDDATTASDVHSWAATVAYAGTGHPPFGRGPSMAIMDRVRRGEFDLDGLPDGLRQVIAAALDPDPLRRPDLGAILAWLRPLTTGGGRGRSVPPPPTEPDPFTVPLALAAHDAAEELTDRYPGGDGPATPYTLALPPENGSATFGPPVEVGAPFAERARRVALLVAAALTTGAAIAAYPWLATGATLILVWLLRSGSLAASAAGDRRRLRGRRWYDGVQFLLAAPWHLVRSVPSMLVLALWAGGISVSAALVCYALSAGLTVSLFLCGVVLAVSLWLGPGGSRVRSPLGRVVEPLSAVPRRWVVAMLAVVLVGGAFALRADLEGSSWTPARGRPHAENAPQGGIARGSMADMQQVTISSEIIIP